MNFVVCRVYYIMSGEENVAKFLFFECLIEIHWTFDSCTCVAIAIIP